RSGATAIVDELPHGNPEDDGISLSLLARMRAILRAARERTRTDGAAQMVQGFLKPAVTDG
ncbi:MAG: hypothetical protein ACE5KS_04325, partial [Woeseiaceae bacterium]